MAFVPSIQTPDHEPVFKLFQLWIRCRFTPEGPATAQVWCKEILLSHVSP